MSARLCGETMPYDKQSFLAGVAAGRNMESWPAFTSSDVDIFMFTVRANQVINYEAEFWGIIYWGDGQTTECMTPNQSRYQMFHAYPAEYTGQLVQVTMIGLFYGINFRYNQAATDNSLISIDTPFPKYPSKNVNGYPITGDVSPYIYYNWFSGCTTLESIPNNLFKAYASDSRVFFTSVAGMFSGCTSLKSVPMGLLKDLRITGTYCDGFFSGCESLESIPSDIIQGREFTIFNYFCENCTALKEIPSGLFSGFSQASEFREAFEGCTSLKSIPADLFDGCSSASDFYRTFRDCSGLTSIPSNLFHGIPSDQEYLSFEETFYRCTSVTSSVPELWVTHSQAYSYTRCFYQCFRAANYSDIPTYWK